MTQSLERGESLRDPNGTPPGGGSSELDQVEFAHRAQAQLRAQMGLWADAQRAANFGTWEWQISNDEVIWSEQLYAILGRDQAGFEPSFNAYVDQVRSDHRDRVLSAIETSLATLRPFHFEHAAVRPDGGERLIRCYGEPVHDDAGIVVRVVGVCQDVTEGKSDTPRVETIDGRFRSAFEHAPTGVALVEVGVDGSATFTEVNRALGELIGRDTTDLIGDQLGNLFADEDRGADRILNARLVAGELDRYTVERRGLRPGGRSAWWFVGMSVVRTESGAISHGIVQIQDISERKQSEDRLRYVADHDSLTGLFNRRRFREELEAQIARRNRYGGEGAVLVIDVDGLKGVNDSLGHSAGDEMLRRLGDVLVKRVRSTDVVARLAGDEFALMLPETPLNESERLAAELVDRLGAPDDSGRELPVSIGVASLGGPAVGIAPVSADQLLSLADKAMYAVKKQGGRGVAVASSEPQPAERTNPPRARLAAVPLPASDGQGAVTAIAGGLPDKVRQALRSRRLMLFAQPAVDLRSGDIVHREVLLRMREDSGEVLSASGFLAAASQRPGLCAEIDRWVVERVLELLSTTRIDQPVNINLSGETLANEVTLQGVIDAVRESGVAPGAVAFELAEAAIGRDLARAESALGRLAETGSALVIDGFRGTFGSYDYLQRLPLTQIKIEGSVVRRLQADPPDHSTIRAIVNVARERSATTVAKLVDSESIVPLLRMHGVDMAQGFRFGLPAPLAA